MYEYQYELHKLSKPSFEVRTDNLSVVDNILMDNCCSNCITSSGNDFKELLKTPCGAEFWFLDRDQI